MTTLFDVVKQHPNIPWNWWAKSGELKDMKMFVSPKKFVSPQKYPIQLAFLHKNWDILDYLLDNGYFHEDVGEYDARRHLPMIILKLRHIFQNPYLILEVVERTLYSKYFSTSKLFSLIN